MFLDKLIKRNLELIEATKYFHSVGTIQPDSYVLDLDGMMENSRLISERASELSLRLYLMTKQFGRNPLVASRLLSLDCFDGIVAVDFREAQTLAKAGLPLGHIGHLVQIPRRTIHELLAFKPQIVTVYSPEAVRFIGEEALKAGMTQPIMVRVWKDEQALYPQQEGGIHISELEDFYNKIKDIKGVELSGVTGFPTLIFDAGTQSVMKTANMSAVKEGAAVLRGLGADIKQLNMPSLNHDGTLALIAAEGGTHAEPGHGVMGTTPDRTAPDSPGKPSICYLSEISHNFSGKSYCYGGGNYVRSNLSNALVGGRHSSISCSSDCIDYYFILDGTFEPGEPVISCSRSQIFVTRSRVSVIEGLSKGRPEIVGTFTAQGERIC